MQQKQTALQSWAGLTAGALHGDFGISRQYGTPAWPLVKSRLWMTTRILLPAVGLGSLFALGLALAGAFVRGQQAYRGVAGTAALACAVPVSVLALFCLLAGMGGPAAVLFVLIAARDLRFFSRLLRQRATAPHLVFARAAGVRGCRMALRHLLWPAKREVAALLLTSLLVGLNACLPVEVVFGVPGVGQLAWSAAMNRDLPVLLTVSLLLAVCIGLAGAMSGRQGEGVKA